MRAKLLDFSMNTTMHLTMSLTYLMFSRSRMVMFREESNQLDWVLLFSFSLVSICALLLYL